MIDKKQFDRVQYIGFVLVSLAWALITIKKGIIFSPDSNTYSHLGDLLIKYDFNYSEFLEHSRSVVHIALYLAWITIVAITKIIFGDNWSVAIVVINYLAAIFSLVLILKLTRMVTRNPICIIFASVALIFCYDYYMWIRYALSDILFASICFSIFFLSISLLEDPSGPQKRIASGAILLGIALFFRPASPPLIVFIFFSILFGFVFKLGASDASKRNRLIIRLTLFACVVIPAVLFFHSHIMLNPEKWPFPFFNDWVTYIAHDYQLGIVVFDRPETFHSSPSSIFDYLFITLSKLLSFFAIDFDGYSKMHALISYMFFLPVYALSVFSISRLYKKENGLSPINWWAIFSCVIFIVPFAFFHSFNQVDYDLRYRVPCLPPLILLATLGLNEFLKIVVPEKVNRACI
jgi:hypothetical protein